MLTKSRFDISLPVLVALFAFLITLGFGVAILRDPDTYMHIAIGRWILAHHAVPHVGIFSETMPNAPWVADEWLAQVILALLYNAGGWNGLVIGTALSFAVALGILTRYLLRWLEPVHALIGTLAAAGMASPHVLARPHILAFPIMVVWFGGLVEARTLDRRPAFWLLPLLTLWSNLHGGFMVGLVFVAIFGAEALLLARTANARLVAAKGWGVFGVLSVLACVITPFGFYTLWLPFHLLQMKFALAALGEWQSPDFAHVQPLEIWLLLVLALGFGYGVRLPPIRLGMLLLLVHLSLVHKRNAELLGFLAPLFVAQPVAALLQRRNASSASWLDHIFARLVRRSNAVGRTFAIAVAAIAGVLYLAYANVRPPVWNAPILALQAARNAHLTNGRVFNQFGFGGYLIFSGVAPFIDGRAELYGDAFSERYLKAIWGWTNDLPKLLDEYNISWAILARDGTAANLMEQMPHWRLVYRDNVAAVYARRTQSAGE